MESGNKGQKNRGQSSGDRARLLSDEFRRSYQWLKNRLRRKVGCQSTAEDLSSEAFVQFVQIPDIHAIQEPRALLTTISQRLVFEFWRRRDLEQAYLRELATIPDQASPSEHDTFEMVQLLFELDRRLSGLPIKVSQAFMLSQLDGMTYADIAQQLDVSVSMVGQYMTKALKHLMNIA
ncbi:sigma-70 family RNA polymerase sigma factor [Paraburkholderia caribensis]|uniref:sigma-70 family RNA polymerase sigma factor n=1 Tax=Paraburkholderia caribensis TaxID=75105 RepID=UPI000722FAA3|nr:sigma-70 family RNA polymerase sigma factor [Paraburkholderia caribensis]ALP68503.1 RNA polymerase subunit sigma [Paraburkholderia caribensis]AUT57857.1 RNA polymerase subunit sigma [Paraburkholderia caribensis]